MKCLKYVLPVLLAGIFFSCTKQDKDENNGPVNSDTSIKGIVAYVNNTSLKNDTLDISFSYKKDTIYLTTKPLPVGAEPIDISKVTLEIEPDKGAVVSPGSPIVLNLNELGSINIKAENGTSQHYFVKAVVSDPYEIFPKFTSHVTQLWSKTGKEMGLGFPGTGKGLAVSGDYLLVLDNAIDKQSLSAIRLYHKLTGEFVKNIKFYEGGWTDPRSYSWNLDTDEAGHLVMGRLNSGGAGFMMDYYNSVDGVPYILLNSIAGADLPDNTGKRFNIVGDLSKGKAYVYASSAHFFGAAKQNPTYAVWEFNDGKPVSTRPAVFTYPGAGSGWYNAVVQRGSIDDNTLYISWCNEDGYPNDSPDKWASLHNINFHMFQPGNANSVLSINPMNFGYRMLDTKVFPMLKGKFMAMLEQSYSTGGAMKVNIFDISDPGHYSMKPGDPDYDSFRIFSSPESTPTSNDGRYGHLAIHSITQNECVIYAYFPNPDPAQAKVVAYKLTVNALN